MSCTLENEKWHWQLRLVRWKKNRRWLAAALVGTLASLHEGQCFVDDFRWQRHKPEKSYPRILNCASHLRIVAVLSGDHTFELVARSFALFTPNMRAARIFSHFKIVNNKSLSWSIHTILISLIFCLFLYYQLFALQSINERLFKLMKQNYSLQK